MQVRKTMDTHLDAVTSVVVIKRCTKLREWWNSVDCKGAGYTDSSISNFILKLGKGEIISTL